MRSAPLSIVRASLGLCLLGIASCGTNETREVLAHYDDGTLETRTEEIRGEDGNWIKEGPFVAYHSNGNIKAQGSFAAGLQNGLWTQWYENGAKGSEGMWRRGEKFGSWKYWHENGNRLAAGMYRKEKSGVWTHWHPDESTQARGSFLFGEKEGLWVYRNRDGSVDTELSGVYEADERIGEMMITGTTTEWYDDDSKRHENEFVDGIRNGKSVSWYPDGTKWSEGQYELGRKTGRWSYWHPDGSVDSERTGEYDGWRKVVAQ